MSRALQAACCVALFPVLMSVTCYAEESENVTRLIHVKGGVVAHLGCGDGRLTEQISAETAYVTQGLEPDTGLIHAARNRLWETGQYGRVSVSRLTGPYLTYADR